ncbi:H+/gluconate symporter [Dethiosulfatibacter aminovorans DSM 17477]|uniref:H+/gluconate symporter n=1 Tax=Dethiosulfatibacter aminovorans DSM 17477 TaxID=1121476 RepID=A0A1M6EID2_9FIRM|nr:Na+/H+ antiporter NhaC family protein [Dethiosulfatibacter aminovorans]SHI85179.1 H+/gluconate symporter [Dethiosulfatibacter aminovorans DSM 17477]
MLGTVGILAGIVLLIYMVYIGWGLFPVSLVASAVILLTNRIGLWDGLSVNYAQGFTSFIGTYFLIFIFGSIFGQLMKDSGSAESIAFKIIGSVGKKKALLATVLATSILSFGGIATFIIIFTMFPIAKIMFEQAKLPKKLIAAAIGLGAGTYTLGALPYSPSLQNIIPTKVLGTDVAAAPLLGVIAGILLFAFGYIYLERQARKELAKITSDDVVITDDSEKSEDLDLKKSDLPNWGLAILPILIVIGTLIALKGRITPIYSLDIALLLGVTSTYLLNIKRYDDFMKSLNTGANNCIMALMTAASVIGFAAVVRSVPGFEKFLDFVLNINLHPYMSVAIGINIIAGIVGSATGGIQIFMETMGPHYLEMGVNPEVLHRIGTLACGGLDSLPHCSSVVIAFMVMGVTHKEAYKDFGVITVLIPIVVTIISVGLAIVLY